MVKRSMEEQERFLVREFLDQQGAKVYNLEGLAQRIPDYGNRGISGPDIWAKVEWQGSSLEVAFEVTDYFLDSDCRGSVSMRRKGIWNAVCHHIHLNHDHTNVFRRLHVSVSFGSKLPTKANILAFAKELTSFLLSHLPKEGSETYYSHGGHCQNSGDFEQYPLLHIHLQRVSVRKTPYVCNPRLWYCTDFAVVGVSQSELTRIVREKTKKFPKYDLAGADECWLLICAGGKSSANRAFLSAAMWASPIDEVLATGVDPTPFQKIILWDRIDGEFIEI
ncbi:MAG: hypothetical protein JNK57_08465 [Planctomycetaceae bacterium]|nr:hypothetical protein [Planctomycetaceae bacterium]